MFVFFKDAESAKISVFMEAFAFDEAVFIEGVMDFAGWAGRANENGDNTDDDEQEKGPPLKDARQNTEQGSDDEESDIPADVMLILNIFLGVPRDVRKGFCHKLIITQNLDLG